MSSSLERWPGAPRACATAPSAGPAAASAASAERHARLRGTATFRGGRLPRWLAGRLFVIGAGNQGGRLALEAVRSGARVVVCDPDVGAEVNLGTQSVEPGVPKALSVVRACDALVPRRAQAICADVRRVGIATLRSCDVLVDCSDDAALAWPLTELSNRLDIPLLRIALDGSGAAEVGRVLTSAGGAGHACQICPLGPADLRRRGPSTPCPGRVPTGSMIPALAPTFAGGALGMAVAGLALLQAQRLVTGNDLDQVLDRELLLDLTRSQLLATGLRRSENCLSRHEHWELVRAGLSVSAPLAEVFALCARLLKVFQLVLEPWGHPLALQAHCACGAQALAVGSIWSEGPPCARCGKTMERRSDVLWPRVSRAQAQELGILRRTPASLGLPRDGALLIARAAGRPPLRLLLDPEHID